MDKGEEVPLEYLSDILKEMKEGGPEFKRMYVLYVMGTLFSSTSHKSVDLRLLNALEDVNEIRKLDWCGYVLDRLCGMVAGWRRKNNKNVGGCLMFLQLIYFHRLNWKEKEAPTALPLVKHWTYDAMRLRIDEEYTTTKFANGRYGLGTWNSTSHPVSRGKVKKIYRRPVAGAVGEEEPRFMLYKLPAHLPNDDDIRRKYTDSRTMRMLMNKRDLELISRLNAKRANELVEIEDQIDHDKAGHNMQDSIDVPTQNGQFSWTQALKDPDFLADFERVGKRIDEVMSEIPSFDLGVFPPSQQPLPKLKIKYPSQCDDPIGGYKRLWKNKKGKNDVGSSIAEFDV